MVITEEMIAEDEKRWHARNIVVELGYCGKNIRHRKNITNDDIRFYAYIMRKAHALLKQQEAVVRCKDCVFRDARDGMCEHVLQIRDPDWYCADGERKEGR